MNKSKNATNERNPSLRIPRGINVVSNYSSSSRSRATYWPTEGWKTTTPEAQGIDSATIADTFQAFQNRNVHSIVIVRNGYLIAEAYNENTQANEPQDMRSVAKGITSALAGIALSDLKLRSMDQKLAEFFPELAHDPLRADIKIRHLLSMSSGLEWTNVNEQSSTEMMYSGDWVRTILQHPGLYKPGTKFNYSNGDAHLVSAVLQRTTGQSMFDYAASRLFGPLGIVNTSWNHDPQGITIGAWALALTARDMAKIGLLYMREGEWDGKSIIPRSWIRETLTKRLVFNKSKQAYGYYWWMKPLAQGLLRNNREKYEFFYAAGSGGVRIFVVPGLQLIVTMTASTPDIDLPEQVLNSVVRAIRSERPLPANSEAQVKLHQAIDSYKEVSAHS